MEQGEGLGIILMFFCNLWELLVIWGVVEAGLNFDAFRDSLGDPRLTPGVDCIHSWGAAATRLLATLRTIF